MQCCKRCSARTRPWTVTVNQLHCRQQKESKVQRPAKKKQSLNSAITVSKASAEERPIKLNANEKALLSEALRRAEETRNQIEDSLLNFGRWILVQVFADNATEAIENKNDNPLWRELRRRAGGPTLRLSERMLYVAIQIAAYDKRITNESWRLLEPTRKEILLPLREDSALRQAAQHVVDMKLSTRATRTYVKQMLHAKGKDNALRMTPARAASSVKKLSSQWLDKRWRHKLSTQLGELDAAEQKRARQTLHDMRAALSELLATLPKS